MIEIKNCPSSLVEGFDTYSPNAAKLLFGGAKVNPILGFDIDEFRNAGEIADAMHRISVSGVQEKFPAIINADAIIIAGDNDRSTHILKPAPWDKTLRDRKMIPANEHLTMQIASQVYGIQTAANGLCFTPKGQPVYITRRFDILPDGSKITAEGICEGKIGYEPIGKDGFGYDPIFMFGDKSFAELSAEEKDAVSHRGKALTELKAKLENYFKNN